MEAARRLEINPLATQELREETLRRFVQERITDGILLEDAVCRITVLYVKYY